PIFRSSRRGAARDLPATPTRRSSDLGFDIGRPQFASGTAYFDRLAADVAKWDLLLSQNPFSTPIFRRAFRYDGEICEYGYPQIRSEEHTSELQSLTNLVCRLLLSKTN